VADSIARDIPRPRWATSCRSALPDRAVAGAEAAMQPGDRHGATRAWPIPSPVTGTVNGSIRKDEEHAASPGLIPTSSKPGLDSRPPADVMLRPATPELERQQQSEGRRIDRRPSDPRRRSATARLCVRHTSPQKNFDTQRERRLQPLVVRAGAGGSGVEERAQRSAAGRLLQRRGSGMRNDRQVLTGPLYARSAPRHGPWL